MTPTSEATQEFTYTPDPRPGPRFRVCFPVDWTREQVPGAIVLLAAPWTEGDFRASLLISVDEVAADAELAAVAEQTLESAAVTYEDLELVQEKVITVADAPALLRFVQFTAAPIDLPVLQMEVLFLLPHDDGSGQHLFQLYGTCLAADSGVYLDAFVDIVQSFERAA